MGQTLEKLAHKELKDKCIFNNRFVVEICELMHVHYRNLRIILSLKDWISLASGFRDSLNRWEKLGKPEPQNGTHIELCRKQVAENPEFDNQISVNLNKNLYALHEGKIFAEGNELSDQNYIHLKIRDLRIELTLRDFNELADAIIEAKEKLCVEQS